MPKLMAYKPGNIIFFAGDRDNRIFILQSGSVELEANDIMTGLSVKEQVKQGEFFGVKNSLVHEPRTDTARALTDCQIVMVTVEEYEKCFAPNKDVMTNMLTNFSKSLRSLHYNTESIFKYEAPQGEREQKMLLIAKAFYEAERYYTAVDQCEKILRDVPNASNKEEITQLLGVARVKASEMAEQEINGPAHVETISESESRAIKQFSNPIFSRFSKKFSSGAVIISEFTKAKSFYFIQSGAVYIEKYINGVMKRYGLLRPGEIFGETEIIDDSDRKSSAIAKGEVSCLKFNKGNFSSIVLGNATVSLIMLRLVCKRIFEQRRNLKILCIKDLSVRMADILIMCTERENARGEDEDDMKRKINVTVDDIAQIAGLNVNTTRDELNKFSARNKIAIYDSYIIIANIMDMKRMVDSYYSNLETAAKPQQQPAKK